jgi:hypothetical protein
MTTQEIGFKIISKEKDWFTSRLAKLIVEIEMEAECTGIEAVRFLSTLLTTFAADLAAQEKTQCRPKLKFPLIDCRKPNRDS